MWCEAIGKMKNKMNSTYAIVYLSTWIGERHLKNQTKTILEIQKMIWKDKQTHFELNKNKDKSSGSNENVMLWNKMRNVRGWKRNTSSILFEIFELLVTVKYLILL